MQCSEIRRPWSLAIHDDIHRAQLYGSLKFREQLASQSDGKTMTDRYGYRRSAVASLLRHSRRGTELRGELSTSERTERALSGPRRGLAHFFFCHIYGNFAL